MKNFSAKTYFQYKEDMLVDRGHDLDKYYPHVVTIANTFPRESMAIGALDINDLIQSGNVGLIEAWERVDWDRIDKSPNPQGELWSFLKIRIKGAIRRAIDNDGSTIKTPRRSLEESRSKLTAHEKIIVNVFPNLRDYEAVIYPESVDPYISIQLEELIDDELKRVVHNINHQDILKMFYGVGFDQMSQKELAEKYRTNHGNIQKIIQRCKSKLNNKEFKNIIETFYLNVS